MKQVTAACAEAVRLGKATFAITGTITLSNSSTIAINRSTMVNGSLEITNTAVDGDELAFGGAFLGELSVSIYSTANRYLFYGASITLQCAITYSSSGQSTTETINYGVWHIAEAKREKGIVHLTAYDNVFLLDTPLTAEVTGTPYTLMSSFATAVGFELAEDEEYYEALPNGEEHITLNADTGCGTIRQCAAALAQATGCFVMANGLGKISFRPFGEEPAMSLGFSHRYSATIADYDCNYIALKIIGATGEYEAVTEVEGVEGLLMTINNAPAWSIGVDETFERMTQALFDYLEPITYTPCELSIFCNPLLEIGDRVKLYTDSASTEASAVETLIMEYTWVYNKQSEITSVGANKFLIGSVDSNTERILRKVQSQIAEEKFIYYAFRNAGDVSLNSGWKDVASVNFVASIDTQAVFNGTFQVTVTIPGTSATVLALGTLKIRYMFNNVAYEQEYTASLTNGSHVITMYQPIASVSKSTVNHFSVQMKIDDADSSMTVPDLHFIGSISGQGLAESIPWDGNITVDDIAEHIEVLSNGAITIPYSVSDSVTVVLNDDHEEIAETASAEFIEQAHAIYILPCFDEVTVAPTVVSISRSYQFPAEWSYQSAYVDFSGPIQLKTAYTYTSTEQVIDSGKMTSVQIVTNDKASVGSVVITSA